MNLVMLWLFMSCTHTHSSRQWFVLLWMCCIVLHMFHMLPLGKLRHTWQTQEVLWWSVYQVWKTIQTCQSHNRCNSTKEQSDNLVVFIWCSIMYSDVFKHRPHAFTTVGYRYHNITVRQLTKTHHQAKHNKQIPDAIHATIDTPNLVNSTPGSGTWLYGYPYYVVLKVLTLNSHTCSTFLLWLISMKMKLLASQEPFNTYAHPVNKIISITNQ